MSQENTPIKDRRYVVMTDSRFAFDKTQFARKKPDCSRSSGFWTDDNPDDVWIMDRKTALDVVSRLHHNNPRIVRAEKAVAKIEEQRAAKIKPPQVVEDPLSITLEDWYARRNELQEDMVFTTGAGELVKLDRRVPGDGTQWHVATWSDESWAYMDSTIEPGDLAAQAEDPDDTHAAGPDLS